MGCTPSDFIFLPSKMLISLLGKVFKGKKRLIREEKSVSDTEFSDFAPHSVSLETMEYRSLGITLICSVNISLSCKSTSVQKTDL